MMTVQSIYKLAIDLGIKADPRGQTLVKQFLQRTKKSFDKLSVDDRKYFDAETLINPYSDTRVLYTSSPAKPIKKAFAGIDCEGTELLLADRLGDIDLVISHHPEGIALADLHTVMEMQVEIMQQAGVPINIAESLLASRIDEVSRGIHPINDHKNVDIARLLNISYMCTHTITDNMVTSFIHKLMQQHSKDLLLVGDVMELLMTIPEYQIGKMQKSAPGISLGNAKRRCGKIAVTEMTGGTNGAKEMFEQLSRAGVGTIIGMHMREDTRKEAEKHHINVIIAGHISSDSIGMNLFLDQLEQRGVEIVPVGGLIRVKRFKQSKKR